MIVFRFGLSTKAERLQKDCCLLAARRGRLFFVFLLSSNVALTGVFMDSKFLNRKAPGNKGKL